MNHPWIEALNRDVNFLGKFFNLHTEEMLTDQELNNYIVRSFKDEDFWEEYNEDQQKVLI